MCMLLLEYYVSAKNSFVILHCILNNCETIQPFLNPYSFFDPIIGYHDFF